MQRTRYGAPLKQAVGLNDEKDMDIYFRFSTRRCGCHCHHDSSQSEPGRAPGETTQIGFEHRFGAGEAVTGEVLAAEVVGRERALLRVLAREDALVEDGRPVCSVCGRPGPGYDTDPKPRRFEFVPLWQIPVYFVYVMRRVNCPKCGVKVEKVPWCDGKTSRILWTVWEQSFVWSVAMTRCPVSAAESAIWAVSRSRISPM